MAEKEIAIIESHKLAPLFTLQDNPEEMLKMASKYAKVLVNIVKQQKLTVVIQTKNYVRVEGWTALAGMLGVFAHTEYSRLLSNRPIGDITYEARITMKTMDGIEISSGEAICSNQEEKKKGQDEYAIKSMAITRATGKACRLAFSWIMALAGFEPTPAEEMDTIITNEEKIEKKRKIEMANEAQIKLIQDTILKSHLLFPFEYLTIQTELEEKGITKKYATQLIDHWLKIEHKKRGDLEKQGQKFLEEYVEKKYHDFIEKYPELADKYDDWLKEEYLTILEKMKKVPPKNEPEPDPRD